MAVPPRARFAPHERRLEGAGTWRDFSPAPAALSDPAAAAPRPAPAAASTPVMLLSRKLCATWAFAVRQGCAVFSEAARCAGAVPARSQVPPFAGGASQLRVVSGHPRTWMSCKIVASIARTPCATMSPCARAMLPLRNQTCAAASEVYARVCAVLCASNAAAVAAVRGAAVWHTRPEHRPSAV